LPAQLCGGGQKRSVAPVGHRAALSHRPALHSRRPRSRRPKRPSAVHLDAARSNHGYRPTRDHPYSGPSIFWAIPIPGPLYVHRCTQRWCIGAFTAISFHRSPSIHSGVSSQLLLFVTAPLAVSFSAVGHPALLRPRPFSSHSCWISFAPFGALAFLSVLPSSAMGGDGPQHPRRLPSSPGGTAPSCCPTRDAAHPAPLSFLSAHAVPHGTIQRGGRPACWHSTAAGRSTPTPPSSPGPLVMCTHNAARLLPATPLRRVLCDAC